MFNKNLVVVGLLMSQMVLAMEGSGSAGAPRGPGIGTFFGLAAGAARLFGRGGNGPDKPKRERESSENEAAEEALRLLNALRAILVQMETATAAQLPAFLAQAQAAHAAYFAYVNGYGVTANRPGPLAAAALLAEANQIAAAAIIAPVVVVPVPAVVVPTPVRPTAIVTQPTPVDLRTRVDALPEALAREGRAILTALRRGDLTLQEAADAIARLEPVDYGED